MVAVHPVNDPMMLAHNDDRGGFGNSARNIAQTDTARIINADSEPGNWHR